MNNCPACSRGDLLQVYNAELAITRGWYCPVCRYFDAAIGRERKLGICTDTPAPINGGTVESYQKSQEKHHEEMS